MSSSSSSSSGIMCLFTQLRRENPSLSLAELRSMVVEAWQSADAETRQHFVRERSVFSLPQDDNDDSASSAVAKVKWSDGDPESMRSLKALKRQNGERSVLRAMSDQFQEISAEEARRLRVPENIVAQVNTFVRKRKAAIANYLNKR